MKKYCIVVLMALAGVVWGQPPDTVWTRTYGGDRYDEFHDVLCTSDGGYLVVGETWSMGAGDRDWYVVKTDSIGHLEWYRTFGGIYDDCANAVVPTSDGGYAICGRLSGDTTRYCDFGLIILNEQGDSIGGRIYGGPDDELAIDLLQTLDDGFIIVGSARGYGAGGNDMWLVRTDVNGDSLWSRTYGGSAWGGARAAALMPDGGFAVAGYTGSRGAGAWDMWLVRMDSLGDSLWSRTYGGRNIDEVSAMQATADGGFILAGYTDSFGEGWENAWLVKTDSAGNLEWQRPYGNVVQAWARDVVQLSDGGYAFSGFYLYEPGDTRAWMVRINSMGDTLWSRQWGISNLSNHANTITLTADGGYVLAGLKDWVSNTITSGNAWLLKTSPDPLETEEHRINIPTGVLLSAYPNPFNATTTLSLSLSHTSPVSLTVFNLLGQAVYETDLGRLNAGEHRHLYDASELPSGVYLARVQAGEQSQMRKMVLLK